MFAITEHKYLPRYVQAYLNTFRKTEHNPENPEILQQLVNLFFAAICCIKNQFYR